MKKVITIIAIFAAFIMMNWNNVYAADLEYRNDGIESVGENEIIIYPNKMNFKHAEDTNDINLTGDLSFIKGKVYSDVDFADGTFDSERGIYYTPTRGLLRDKNRTEVTQKPLWVIGYTRPLTAGEHDINGTATIRFREAAKTNDGVLCDVILTMDNIKLKTARNLAYGFSLLESLSEGEELVNIGVQIFQQEANGNFFLEHLDLINYYPSLGASYDISVKIVKANTNEPVNKKLVLIFKDLDNYDYTTSSAEWLEIPYLEGGNYAEHIVLVDGFNEVVHLESDSYIGVDNHPEYGNNTIYYGTELDDNTYKSGLSTRANASGYKIHWTGSSCATHFGIVGYYSITTSKIGENKDHGTITETDEEVLWKADKEIVIRPDDGYKIGQIIIDDESIVFEPNEDGSFKYTFEDVLANHSIKAEFIELDDYTIRTKTDGNGTIEVVSNAKYKDRISFKIIPKKGYKLKELRITSDSGESITLEEGIVEGENLYEELDKIFVMPSDNVTIEAKWEIINPKTTSNGADIYVFAIFITAISMICYRLKTKKVI